MTSGTDWQANVGRSWAELYRKTDRSFVNLTTHLLERLAPLPGETVLDIGCGAGELTLAVARARPGAQVTGIDLSEDLISAAQERAGERERVQFALADASLWEPNSTAPDLLISRHGVMFFPDPPLAFAHLRRIAAPGANFAFSCFRTPRENPWASEIAAMLAALGAKGPPADPHAPGPFAFADPDHVRAILAAAGWTDLAFEPFDYAFVAGLGDDPLADAAEFFSRIGPAAAALRQLPEDERDNLQLRIDAWLERNCAGNMVAFPAAAWIVTARNG